MAESIVIRCDGGDAVGAGHVSRCLPVARALSARGAEISFAGDFDGVAAWMLERQGATVEAPANGPCGVDPERWTGAVVDLYLSGGAAEVCELAAVLPVATIGEATRCPDAGLWIDYHAGAAPGANGRRLGGPRFAPIDPRFASGRRERAGVERILVMTGGSTLFGGIPGQLADAAADAFPDAEVVAPAAVADAATRAVARLPAPFDLAEIAAGVDVALVAAGMTVYELASAGIPLIAVGLVENQRVVINGCEAAGIALAVDGIGRDPIPGVVTALAKMQAPELRTELGAKAVATLDGHGAARIADALLAAWTPGSEPDPER